MGETIGVWIGDEDSILEDFDEHFGARDGAEYSRSKRIKDAMELAIAIDDVLQSIEMDDDISDRGTRVLIKSAIRNELSE
jgi:hypothetical protein